MKWYKKFAYRVFGALVALCGIGWVFILADVIRGNMGSRICVELFLAFLGWTILGDILIKEEPPKDPSDIGPEVLRHMCKIKNWKP